MTVSFFFLYVFIDFGPASKWGINEPIDLLYTMHSCEIWEVCSPSAFFKPRSNNTDIQEMSLISVVSTDAQIALH